MTIHPRKALLKLCSIMLLICAEMIFSSVSYAQSKLQSVEALFKEGMPYSEMRKALSDAGWLPLRDPMCWENTGDQATVCTELPETESCSSDGYCNLNFANAVEQKSIRIGTYGDYSQWNKENGKGNFTVRFWEISAIPAPKETASCPSDNFDLFLKSFASDATVKVAFTNPLVKVSELVETEDAGYTDRFVYMLRINYNDFNIINKNNEYHFVSYEGNIDTDPLPLEISDEGKGRKLVRYQYGMSEGNSYLFEFKNDCWYLTEDPEPPSP